MSAPFRRPLSALVFTLALAAGLALGTAPTRAEEEAEVDHQHLHHSFVRITGGKLSPPTVEVAPDAAFGWVNYSSKIARVSFPAETAKAMTCTSRGSFRLNGDRLESGPIQARQFASLCQLREGEYGYRVSLYRGIGGGASQTPERSFEGKIVVAAPPAS